MGAEKFHIAVTIDSARQIASVLTLRFLQNLARSKWIRLSIFGSWPVPPRDIPACNFTVTFAD
jgi:hypothetical protein